MTEESIGPPTPVCPLGEDSKKAPMELPPSISHFYSDPRAKPSALLKAIRSSKLGSFSDEDQAEALRSLDDADPRLLRTLKLTSASIPKTSTSTVPPTILWVARVVRTALQIEGFALDDLSKPTSLTYREICEACGRIAVRNPKEARKALNLAAIAAAWLRVTRGLEPEDLLSALGESGLLGKIDGSSATHTTRVVSTIVKAPVRLDVARALLAQELNGRIRRSALEASARRLQSEVQRTSADLQAARTSMELLERQLQETGIAIAALNRDLELSAKRLQDQQIQSRHDLNALHDRYSSFLKALRDRWLSSAVEAGRMAPPRTAVMIERLEMAIAETEQELLWLTSLD